MEVKREVELLEVISGKLLIEACPMSNLELHELLKREGMIYIDNRPLSGPERGK